MLNGRDRQSFHGARTKSSLVFPRFDPVKSLERPPFDPVLSLVPKESLVIHQPRAIEMAEQQNPIEAADERSRGESAVP